MSQTMTALNLANEIRSKRAEARREVFALPMAEGRAKLADLVENPPEWLCTAEIGKVLTWPRRTGPQYARRMLLGASGNGFPLRSGRKVQDINIAQLRLLAAMLRGEVEW